MSIALADLVTRLQGDVPARGSVPSAGQYEQAVKDAVADYGRRRPMEKVTTLTVVSGTADYTLPDGFVRVIVLAGLCDSDGVLNTTSGLIPVSATYEETWTIAGLTLTFHPTPSYGTTRDLRYAAAHVLNDSDLYPSMTDDDARIVLLKAAAICLRLQARSVAIAGEMAEYQIGDERVKRVVATDKLAAAADMAEADYETALARGIGPVGIRSSYNWMGQ